MSSNNSEKTPQLLDQVASLTAIRDLELFEFSFMKALADMLKTHIISLYKFNSINNTYNLVRYTSTNHTNVSKHVIDIANEIHVENNAVVSNEIIDAIAWIGSTDNIFSAKQGDDFLIVYPISDLYGSAAFLAINLPHKLSNSENLVISSLLNISHNFYNLLEENQKDKLTGLLNRKTFDDNISKIQNLLNRHEEETYSGKEKRKNGTNTDDYWLAIVDIDFFKNINDSYGHVYGDEVLLMLSQLMKETFRSYDLLFRFGGEEFVIIVNVEDKQEANQAFERFRITIEKFMFPQVGKVTISLGATLIMDEYVVPSDIVGRADKALYHAKDTGRNKLYFYEDLVEKGILEENPDQGDLEFF